MADRIELPNLFSEQSSHMTLDALMDLINFQRTFSNIIIEGN